MKIKDLQGKLVGILGFGQEGKAVLNYLVKNGITPALIDQKPWQDWLLEDQQIIKDHNVNFIFGPDAFMELKGFDVIFRSPGVKMSDIITKVSQNTIITSQTKWFFEQCPAKIIGITGTKGKGTTSSLIYELLSEHFKQTEQNKKVFLTGNIGKIQALEILDELEKNDIVVCELSSFQLQDLHKSPHIGVVLMTTSEHLDYHLDAAEYVEAKSSIVKFQTEVDFAVINKDFLASVEIGEQSKGKKTYFSRRTELNEGCYVKDGQIWFKEFNQQAENIIDTNQVFIKGKHNLENICAAICVGKILHLPSSLIKQCVQKFKGLEHRLEFAGIKSDIKFYNDSFSTTPETAIAAIESFTEPEIIILGGSEKKSNFADLGKTIINSPNIKVVIVIGVVADKIKKAILNAGNFKGDILEGAQDMEQIFDQVKKVASRGDVVLLSPACASFGMFKNYKDRGAQFILQVNKL
jgi:UDP-N-acetylmuramoylalanine--D-glutamate ligase